MRYIYIYFRICLWLVTLPILLQSSRFVWLSVCPWSSLGVYLSDCLQLEHKVEFTTRPGNIKIILIKNFMASFPVLLYKLNALCWYIVIFFDMSFILVVRDLWLSSSCCFQKIIKGYHNIQNTKYKIRIWSPWRWFSISDCRAACYFSFRSSRFRVSIINVFINLRLWHNVPQTLNDWRYHRLHLQQFWQQSDFTALKQTIAIVLHFISDTVRVSTWYTVGARGMMMRTRLWSALGDFELRPPC